MPTTFGCPILATSLFLWLGWGSTKTVFICRIYKPSAPAGARATPSSLSSPPRHSQSSPAAYPSTLRVCHKAAAAPADCAAIPSPPVREQGKACTTSSHPACSPSASYKSPDSPCPTTPLQPARTTTNSHPSPAKKQSAHRSHSREYF